MIKKFFEFHSADIELHYYALDWDDNILHMPTKILMDKKEGEQWVPVDVSTSEFAVVRNDKENYRLRDDNPTIAFSEFRDTGKRGNDAFIEDVQKAIDQKAYAPSWNAFLKCLSEGAIFAIITARGHEPDSIRRGVEYVIDNILTKTPSTNPNFSLADEMFQHLRKYHYMFGMDSYEQKQLQGVPSENELISNYLDTCGFYGVSSESFKQEFGEGSASNPEKAKEMALDYFIDKCNEFGTRIGAKTVSVGFSDDDPKNVEHVEKFFKEKLPNMSGVKLSLYKTTDPTIAGGEIKKFTETSNQAVGLESSTMSIRDNMTKRLYPSTQDAPFDDFHNRMKNQNNMVKDLTKDTVMKFDKKPRRSKRLKKKTNI